MKKKSSVFIGIIMFVVLMVGAYLLYGMLKKGMDTTTLSTEVENETKIAEHNTAENNIANEETQTEETTKAPDFTVFDADGNEVTLSDFFGKPIILNFWASWCDPCKSEMPEFDEQYATYGNDIQFLMVNMTDGSRETLKTAKKYIETEGFSFPVYYDTEMEAAMTYQVYSLPTTYFLDEKGYVVAEAKGELDKETLQKGIDMIAIKK